jgi:hypothetical protein
MRKIIDRLDPCNRAIALCLRMNYRPETFLGFAKPFKVYWTRQDAYAVHQLVTLVSGIQGDSKATVPHCCHG